mmetsp:Transcript_12663/g.39844  ORF Transcript_12663/g.39844 Transcript_12663/m.39844 type:complete len:264 (+) Transcript_12663:1665-2456(+)
MEADHGEARRGQRAAVLAQHLVHILVVTPRHDELVHAARGLVNAVLRRVDRVLRVRVELHLLGKDDLVGERAAERERVADRRPLRLAPERDDFADIVQEADQVEPIVLLARPVLADALGRLEVVDRVGQRRVGVGIVNEPVEQLDRIEDGHLGVIKLEPLGAAPLDEVKRLVHVHLAVGLLHDRVPLRVGVVAELLLRLLAGSLAGGRGRRVAAIGRLLLDPAPRRNLRLARLQLALRRRDRGHGGRWAGRAARWGHSKVGAT